jgi:hypothetical protein
MYKASYLIHVVCIMDDHLSFANIYLQLDHCLPYPVLSISHFITSLHKHFIKSMICGQYRICSQISHCVVEW